MVNIYIYISSLYNVNIHVFHQRIVYIHDYIHIRVHIYIYIRVSIKKTNMLSYNFTQLSSSVTRARITGTTWSPLTIATLVYNSNFTLVYDNEEVEYSLSIGFSQQLVPGGATLYHFIYICFLWYSTVVLWSGETSADTVTHTSLIGGTGAALCVMELHSGSCQLSLENFFPTVNGSSPPKQTLFFECIS